MAVKTARYASESITAACDWAYKGVQEDSTLQGTTNITLLLLSCNSTTNNITLLSSNRTLILYLFVQMPISLADCRWST